MKRLPVCFGDYLPHDRSCNGHGTTAPCLVRDRCSAFRNLLSESGEKREDRLRATSRYTYAQPDLVAALDLMVGRLGIRDGLIPRVKARGGAAKVVTAGPSSEDLVQLFVNELSQASRRKLKPRPGAADIGEIFCVPKFRISKDLCVRCVYVRVDAAFQDLICCIKPKRALVDITVPMQHFEELFSKRERSELQFSGLGTTTTLLNLDRYRCSFAAHRLAGAINGGPLDKPRAS